MRYEVEATSPPTSMEFDILEDGEPPQEVAFPARAGTDARFFRAFALKPTVEVEGATLSVRAYQDGVLVGSASCPNIVVIR